MGLDEETVPADPRVIVQRRVAPRTVESHSSEATQRTRTVRTPSYEAGALYTRRRHAEGERHVHPRTYDLVGLTIFDFCRSWRVDDPGGDFDVTIPSIGEDEGEVAGPKRLALTAV